LATLNFGVLPYVLEQVQQQQGFATIVGLGLLETHKISLSLKTPVLKLERHRNHHALKISS
jgi:hypothetical protein